MFFCAFPPERDSGTVQSREELAKSSRYRATSGLTPYRAHTQKRQTSPKPVRRLCAPHGSPKRIALFICLEIMSRRIG